MDSFFRFPREQAGQTPHPSLFTPHPLFLLPAAWALIPPTLRGIGDPALGEDRTDLALPFGMAIGPGNLRIKRVAVAVLLGNQLFHGVSIGRWHDRQIADS